MAASKGSGSLDFKSFKKPTGFLKLIALVFIIICLCLARAGIQGHPVPLIADYQWLVITTTCGFFIIMLILLTTRVMGKGLAIPVELALLILGLLMFIASGGVVIDQYAAAANVLNSARPAALALGSMCIFTGLVFFVDVVFTALDISK